MMRTTFASEDVAKGLVDYGITPVGRAGSHLKLRHTTENTDEVRNVTVPISKGTRTTGTLRSIAKQAGTNDFEKFCEWIEENR
ncbi:type II toxin-antitoxin system HicA family toxin [Haladaptatus sp. DFWS20]|uniref:type II toxin-antitoxin system HicA family toxin n=1 Tax=Haladaptatus sp. DFWS20 TaxID=3403467 RepID=UPI003EBE51DE